MKVLDQASKLFSRAQWCWSKAYYTTGFGPPPWYREKFVDTIDRGYRLMVDVRTYQNDSGDESFLIDLIDKQDHETIALLKCCDVMAVIELLLEVGPIIQRYKNSVPIEEWADD